MTKMKLKMVGTMALLVMAMPLVAQTAEPSAPAPQAAAPVVTLPAPNPKNFTAAVPTKETVDSFLKALWGYDENRIWSVAGIFKTRAPGVAKVVVFVADKSQPGTKPAETVFFTTPDGMHAVAGDVIDFGAKPFAAARKVLQERATGPAKGASSTDLELVEFADLQCPHCKEAQDTMDQLAQDFPQARIVFQNFPLSEIHPYAAVAAAEGVCVRKAKGDAAFFTYAAAVFNTQGALTPDSYLPTLASAAKKAGADYIEMAKCAESQAAKDEVKASYDLGVELGVDQTPLLAVNGHLLPLGSIPYEVLKKIIVYQAAQDGIVVKVQPTLTNLK